MDERPFSVPNRRFVSNTYRIENLEGLVLDKSIAQLPTPYISRSFNPLFKDAFTKSFEEKMKQQNLDVVATERKKGIEELKKLLNAKVGLRDKLLHAIESNEILDAETREMMEKYGSVLGTFSYEFNCYEYRQTQEIKKGQENWDYENDVPAINQGGELEDLFKYVSAQRWMKNERTSLEREGVGFKGKEQIVNDINDDNFGKVIDKVVEIVDNPRKAAWFFTDILAKGLKTVHFDSEVYKIHSDAGAETISTLKYLQEKYGELFPLPEQPYSWKVINTNFLMGDIFFWQHLQKKFPEVFYEVKKNMIQILKPGSKHFSSGQHPINDNGEIIQAQIDNRVDFNALMSEYCPEVLELLEIPIQQGGVIETQHAFIDYNFYITYKPEESLRLLLGERIEN